MTISDSCHDIAFPMLSASRAHQFAPATGTGTISSDIVEFRSSSLMLLHGACGLDSREQRSRPERGRGLYVAPSERDEKTGHATAPTDLANGLANNPANDLGVRTSSLPCPAWATVRAPVRRRKAALVIGSSADAVLPATIAARSRAGAETATLQRRREPRTLYGHCTLAIGPVSGAWRWAAAPMMGRALPPSARVAPPGIKSGSQIWPYGMVAALRRRWRRPLKDKMSNDQSCIF